MAKLNRPMTEMLARIAEHNSERGPMLALLIMAAGGGEAVKLRRLIALDLVEIVDHPTVKTRDRILDQDVPSQALQITADGLAMLDLRPEHIGQEERPAKPTWQELADALRSAVKVAEQAEIEWDQAPGGMRAGKILLALCGRVPGYRTDTDAIHNVLGRLGTKP